MGETPNFRVMFDAFLLQRYAEQFVTLSYKWGGDDPIDGFDCSGLVQELLAVFGMDPPGDQTAQKLFEFFQYNGYWNKRQCGALAFYGKSATKITHVGMFVTSFIIVEAAGGTHLTKNKSDAARMNAYIRFRPFNHRNDLRAVILPQYPGLLVA